MDGVVDIDARITEIDRLLEGWPRAPHELEQIKEFIKVLSATDLGRQTLSNLGLDILLPSLQQAADIYEQQYAQQHEAETAILDAFNHQYFMIEDSAFTAVSVGQISDRLNGKPEDWPHIFITSRDNRTDPARMVNNMLAAPDIAKAAGMERDVLAISAYYSEPNMASNAVRTLRRVHEVRHHMKKHDHLSAASSMISVLIEGLAAHSRKPDAVMENLTLLGFSEGANIVTDAARLLSQGNMAPFLPRARILMVAPGEAHYNHDELKVMPPRMGIYREEDAVCRAFGKPFTLNDERDARHVLERGKRGGMLGHDPLVYEQRMLQDPETVAKLQEFLVTSRSQQRGASLG